MEPKEQYRLYVIKHKTLKAVYIRYLSLDTEKTSDSKIFVSLRNCLMSHLTSNATEERKRIHAFIQENSLELSPHRSRNTNWTADWILEQHSEHETSSSIIACATDLASEFVKEGYIVLNSKIPTKI